MKPRYIVNTLGYTHGPQFSDLGEARAVLADNVAAAVTACKRKFGRANKIKVSQDSYRVSATRDPLSSLWGAYWITTIK